MAWSHLTPLEEELIVMARKALAFAGVVSLEVSSATADAAVGAWESIVSFHTEPGPMSRGAESVRERCVCREETAEPAAITSSLACSESQTPCSVSSQHEASPLSSQDDGPSSVSIPELQQAVSVDTASEEASRHLTATGAPAFTYGRQDWGDLCEMLCVPDADPLCRLSQSDSDSVSSCSSDSTSTSEAEDYREDVSSLAESSADVDRSLLSGGIYAQAARAQKAAQAKKARKNHEKKEKRKAKRAMRATAGCSTEESNRQL